MMSLVTLTLILFLIMDPVGHVNAFSKYVEGIDQGRQRSIILREMFIALGVILFFDLLGEYIFQILGISDITVYLSSGIILFIVAIKIIFTRAQTNDDYYPKGEPFIVPLAVPWIAGPALCATVMLYADTESRIWPLLVAILLSWLASMLILLNSKTLIRFLGTNGLKACEKLMGMVLILLAVQRFLEGVLQLSKSGANG